MSPELGFACPLCVKRKSFKRFHNFKKHLQTVHGFDTTSFRALSNKTKGKKPMKADNNTKMAATTTATTGAWPSWRPSTGFGGGGGSEFSSGWGFGGSSTTTFGMGATAAGTSPGLTFSSPADTSSVPATPTVWGPAPSSGFGSSGTTTFGTGAATTADTSLGLAFGSTADLPSVF